MDCNNNNIGRILELTLDNNYFYVGRCIDEDNLNIIIIDKNNDRVEIAKNNIIMKKVVSNG